MIRPLRRIGSLSAVALAAAACAESTTPSATSLADAFLSTPAGFSATTNSYAAGADGGGPFMPHGGHGHDRGPGGLMGGGLGPGFLGGIGFGRGIGRGPFGDHDLDGSCAFSSTSQRVECSAQSEHGLTVTRSTQFRDAAGSVQQAFDSLTTNSINVRTAVSGTVTRRDSATATVQHSSDRTVTGLAAGSTQRTVNGTSQGTETSTGTSDAGAFTASRLVSDTVSGVVIPLAEGRPTYPTAGTIIRNMSATVTFAGRSPKATSRREVVTYDGSATATVVITQDGTTRTCALPLARGTPTCQ